jgi:hypothetical protein
MLMRPQHLRPHAEIFFGEGVAMGGRQDSIWRRVRYLLGLLTECTSSRPIPRPSSFDSTPYRNDNVIHGVPDDVIAVFLTLLFGAVIAYVLGRALRPM